MTAKGCRSSSLRKVLAAPPVPIPAIYRLLLAQEGKGCTEPPTVV